MSTFAKSQARQQQTPAQAKPPMPQRKAEPQPMPQPARATADEIRPLAYQKWQEAGSPAGDGTEFWLAAETELLRRQKPR